MINDRVYSLALHRFKNNRSATKKCNEWNTTEDNAHAFIDVVTTEEEVASVKAYARETLDALLGRYYGMTAEYAAKQVRWLDEWFEERHLPTVATDNDSVLFDPALDDFAI
jgi:hypothetical protein